MELKKITIHDLKNELTKMAVSCIDVKENTAKRKASEIYYKYECLFHDSNIEKIFAKNCNLNQRKAIEALKSGRIHYTTRSLIPNAPQYNGSAYIEISEIESIVFESYLIRISLKSNKVICLNPTDYEYLKYLYV